MVNPSPKPGRPPVDPSEKSKVLAITLPPKQAAWLRSRPNGISPELQRLIREAMEAEGAL